MGPGVAERASSRYNESMGKALRELIDLLDGLPEESRETWARSWLAELAADREWDARFNSRPDALRRLAQEALDEDRAGATRPLDDLLKSS
jgi:hypothetical protein